MGYRDLDPADNARFKSFGDYVFRILLREPLRSGETKGGHSRRVLGFLLLGLNPKTDKDIASNRIRDIENGVRKMPIGEMVMLLGNLRRHILNETPVERKDGTVSPIEDVPEPSNVRMLEALQLVMQLNPLELEALGLPAYSQHPLLQQAIINLATMPIPEGRRLPSAYRDVYQRSLNTTELSSKTFKSFRGVTKRFEKRFGKSDKSTQTQMLQDVIKRILLQAGTGHLRYVSLDDQDQYIRDYIDSSFVDKLSDTVVHNDRLRRRFPIHLKKITIEPYGPFPFQELSDKPETSFFSKTLLNEYQSEDESNFAPVDKQFDQLPTRNVRLVTGHFYISLDSEKIDGQSYIAFLNRVRYSSSGKRTSAEYR